MYEVHRKPGDLWPLTENHVFSFDTQIGLLLGCGYDVVIIPPIGRRPWRSQNFIIFPNENR